MVQEAVSRSIFYMERMGISLFPLRIRQQILSFSCLFQYALTGQFFQDPLQLPATVMQQQRGLLYLCDFVIRAFETEMIKKFVFQCDSTVPDLWGSV